MNIEQAIREAALCERKFRQKGFVDVKPGVNVGTIAEWAARGRVVRRSEIKCFITVGGKRLFHEQQTDKREHVPRR
jgi:hypothetical protein